MASVLEERPDRAPREGAQENSSTLKALAVLEALVRSPRPPTLTQLMQATGLPKTQAWWTVKRQAMTADQAATVGVYFGTTSGELWGSRDEGRTWKCLARHLPHIYALEMA